MRRFTVLFAATLLTVALPAPAYAATHAPCLGHNASIPRVAWVDRGVTTLSGGGSISGCPLPAGVESVTVTVALQHLQDGVWVDQVVTPFTGVWTRAYRYARATGGTVYATCVPGWWRTQVTGGDGYTPYVWASTAVTFSLGDSGVCGAYGGGD